MKCCPRPRLFLSLLWCACIPCATVATAEVRSLTLQQAIDLAIAQNPEVVIARFEEHKAAEQVKIVNDPFTPKVGIGSGLAYTSGFPMSVEGSAPSLLQARWTQSLYNQPKKYEVLAAKESARSTAFDTESKRDEAVYQTALLYLDLEQLNRAVELAGQQLGSAEKITDSVQERFNEGRELPIEVKRAQLRSAQARQQLEELQGNLDYTEASLAVVLGFSPEDRVRVVPRERPLALEPLDDQAAITAAVSNNNELKRLQSAMQARALEQKGARSSWQPQVDLVAQYALFAKFNNYEDYFQTFERHNGQLGVSLALPIVPGGGAKARAAQAQVELNRLQKQLNAVRNRLVLDARRSLANSKNARLTRDVARLDLDVAREQLSVILAQFEEGQVNLRQVEEARSLETREWLEFYQAQHVWERAELEVLKATGTLLATLR